MAFKQPDLTFGAIVFSWLVAIAAFAGAVLIATAGQGFGTWLGDGEWIGVSTPIHRHPWALVNQPNLAFAASRSAYGYWLGSLSLGLGTSLATGLFLSRIPSVAGQLIAVQLSWATAVLSGAWFPLIDLKDGHLARFLSLHHLPDSALWMAPVLAGMVAIPAILRLLALGRSSRDSFGRIPRLLIVTVVLGPPLFVWIAAATILGGSLPIKACIACAAPLITIFAIAWMGWGRFPVINPEPVNWQAWFGATLAAALLVGAVWLAGRPLADGQIAGVIWRKPNGFNNIRSWIDARPPAEWFGDHPVDNLKPGS
ncbi:MAG: hypothetical protein GY906_02375 [bacterium]|nr:hypothetical protein [bacterium]